MIMGLRIQTVMNVSTLQKAVDLAVSNDHFTQRLCPQHCRFHHLIALYAPTIVGKGNTRWGHALQICKFLSLLTNSYSAVGIDMNDSLLFD